MSAAGSTYRDFVHNAVATSAGPHGYTLTLWTAGAIASNARGRPPAALDAFLLLAGAVPAFGFVGSVAGGGLRRPIPSPRQQNSLWGALHLPTVTRSIALCRALTVRLHGHALWPAIGVTATATFLLGSALQARCAGACTRHRSRDDSESMGDLEA
jgi:hypothetical protein